MTIIVMMSIVVIPKKQCRIKFPFTPAAAATLPSVSAAITQLGWEGDTLLNIQLLNFLMLNFQLSNFQLLNFQLLNFQLLNCVNSKSW